MVVIATKSPAGATARGPERYGCIVILSNPSMVGTRKMSEACSAVRTARVGGG